MNMLDKFEQGLENAMNSAFSKFSKNDLKPADYVMLLQKDLDKNAIKISQDRTVAPNKFTLLLSTKDFDNIEAWGAEAFADELAMTVNKYANSQQYAFPGPVSITFEEDVEAEKGRVAIKSESVRAESQDPSQSQENQPAKYLEIKGKKFPIVQEKTVAGRDPKADIVIDDPGISRRHFEIRSTSAGTVITDLGSTNGIYVEGHHVPAATLLDGNTIVAGRTTIIYHSN
jgi:hypothetical protein